jgi:hypothetical protein
MSKDTVTLPAAKEQQQPAWRWRKTGRSESGLTEFGTFGRVGAVRAELRDDVDKGYALVEFEADSEPTADGGRLLETVETYSEARERVEAKVRETPDLMGAFDAPPKRAPKAKREPRTSDGKSHEVVTRQDDSIKRPPAPKKGGQRRKQRGVSQAQGATKVA